MINGGTRSQTFSSGMERATNYNRWIVRSFSPFIHGTVLEVGIGHGNFADLLAPYTKSYVGVDIDAGLVESARAAHPEHTYIVADITSTALIEATQELEVNTILACNILEHVPDDKIAIRQLLRALQKGGHLLLYVPAFPALFNKMDLLAGHFRRYTTATLAEVLPEDLCSIIRLDYVNPLGAVGWWANGVLNRNLTDLDSVNEQIAIFDRYIQPISEAISPLFSKLFGQSIVCVARRR